MKIFVLFIFLQILGLTFGLKCFHCAFDEDAIEKDCAVNPTKNPTEGGPTEKECRRGNACLTQVGDSVTEDGTKSVEYRTCGKMEEGLDTDNCKEETLDSLTVKTCFCQGELCNAPGSSGLPVWAWIVIALVVVLIIGAIVALIIWKLKGESSKKIPKAEAESVPLKSQEATKTDGEDQKSQEAPNDVP